MGRTAHAGMWLTAAFLLANGCADDETVTRARVQTGSTARAGAANAGSSAMGRAGGTEAPENLAGGATFGDAGAANAAGAAGLGATTLVGDLSRDILDTSLEIDLATQTGRATIALAASPSRSASFEIGDLDIASVVSGTTTLGWVDRGALLDIEVPPSTEPLVLTIDYAWHLHELSDGVSANGYTYTWPYYCGNVFPCHSDPADGMRLRLKLEGLSPTDVAIYPTELSNEAPAYMPAWAVGQYTRALLGTTDAGTRLTISFLPGGLANAAAGATYLLSAFNWLEQHLGPYLFGSDAGPVAVPWYANNTGGMEHHPYWHIAVVSMGEYTTQVHEALHGWFGNGVRLRCWEDFVLSEGTVTYLTARVLEEVAGTTVSDPVWRKYQAELTQRSAGSGNRVAWPSSCGEVDILKDGLYSRIPYLKGAFFYLALEQKIGRPLLDAALQTFYQRWAGKAAGMQDMLDVILEVSGYDAQQCAEAWLVNLPPLPAAGPCP
jgi:hypothetical protein